MTDITANTVPSQDGTLSRRFYFTAWRWHFYAGLYVAPFLVMLALTGLIMLWSSVLLGRDGEYIYPVKPGTEVVAISKQVEAATAAVPNGAVVQYIAPRGADVSALFRVNAGESSFMVAVDPYSGKVLGQWDRRNGLYDLANVIHGTLLIGTLGDRLIEIAAGFGVMLIVTGLYLWWPRDGKGFAAMAIPQFSARGRLLWKSLHQSIGFWCSIVLLAFLLSGLSWAGIWGDRFTQAWSTFPAAKWDNVPLSDKTHAHLNHNGIKEVPWALEQTPLPASGSKEGKTGLAEGQAVDVDNIVAFAREIGFDGRFQLSFPGGDDGVWTLARDTMSNDSANPMSDRTVHIDQFTGKILADVGFTDYGVAGKAMAVGIALHEGDMGWWNVTLNTVFCLSIIFMAVSGIVMWWKRRPAGAGRLVAPAIPSPSPVWKTGALVMIAVAVLFPLSGAVLIAVLAIDMLLLRHIKPLKRAIS
jgi:uncharacterized iron-regulated membrane protein